MLFIHCNPGETQLLKKTDLAPFGVCYSKVKPEQTRNYRLVILEPDLYSAAEISQIHAAGTRVIGYLSLGEVNPYRWYYPELKQLGFLGQNENWGSYYINLEDPDSRDLLINKAALQIYLKGFDGFFLDTIDAVAPYTERSNLEEEMLSVIEGLRSRFPKSLIIQNAGLFLLDRSQKYIDAVAIEDIASSYDFKNNEYKVLNASDFEERIRLIKHYQELSGLPFLIIDFADSAPQVEKVRQKLEPLNIPYFISSIALDTLPANPEKVTNTLIE